MVDSGVSHESADEQDRAAYNLASEFFVNGRYSETVVLLEDLHQKYPGQTNIIASLARTHLALDNNERAADLARRLVQAGDNRGQRILSQLSSHSPLTAETTATDLSVSPPTAKVAVRPEFSPSSRAQISGNYERSSISSRNTERLFNLRDILVLIGLTSIAVYVFLKMTHGTFFTAKSYTESISTEGSFSYGTFLGKTKIELHGLRDFDRAPAPRGRFSSGVEETWKDSKLQRSIFFTQSGKRVEVTWKDSKPRRLKLDGERIPSLLEFVFWLLTTIGTATTVSALWLWRSNPDGFGRLVVVAAPYTKLVLAILVMYAMVAVSVAFSN